jgi:hypothetical protein
VLGGEAGAKAADAPGTHHCNADLLLRKDVSLLSIRSMS